MPYPGHADKMRMLRETGFQGYLRQHAPAFTLLDSMVNLDTRQVTYEATLDLLSRRPDLRGIYVAGGGMEGAIAALREAIARLSEEHRSVLVLREIEGCDYETMAGVLDRDAKVAIVGPRTLNSDGTPQVSFGPQLTPLSEWRQRRLVHRAQRRDPLLGRRVGAEPRPERFASR